MKLKLKILAGIILASIAISGIFMLVFENAEFAKVTIARNEEQKKADEEARRQAEIDQRQQDEEDDAKAPYVEYDVKNQYYQGLALVKKDGKWGYIDKNGHVKIPLIYDSANNFMGEKIAKVKKDNLWGYINTEGKEVIPVDYYFCGEISNGIIAVGKGGKYGFIDRNGNKVCDLIYDRVEPFSSEGTAKVVLDRKFGYINTSGVVIVPIENPSNEENADFTGTWNRTKTHSSLGAKLEISHQMATSFDFKLTSNYYSISDTFEGTAEITSTNTAKYVYGYGTTQDTITFTIADDWLEITSILGGNLDMSSENKIIGTYVKGSPTYDNEGLTEKLFAKEDVRTRIRQTIGEDLYEDDFLYGLRNGLYTEEKLKDSSVIKGTVYHVWVPTTEKDYKLLVNDMYVYFYSKSQDIYKTDDPDRQSRIPSDIAYDEL